MHPSLQKKLTNLERQKEALVSDVAILPAEQMQFRPNATAWSILDILEHLVKVEDATLSMIRVNLPDGKAVTLRDRMGALMVTSVMRTNIRVKVPAGATVVIPDGGASFAELTANWCSARQSMTTLLDELNVGQLRIGLFRHPIGGWMNMAQTLEFLSAHLQHHVRQVNHLKVVGANKT